MLIISLATFSYVFHTYLNLFAVLLKQTYLKQTEASWSAAIKWEDSGGAPGTKEQYFPDGSYCNYTASSAREGRKGKRKKSNIFLAHSNLKEPFQRFAVCFCFLPISTREELRYIYGLTEKSSVKQYLTYFFRENPKP